MSEITLDEVKKVGRNGLWDMNPVLVQLLGLCPLLAVSGTAVNGLGMGLATTLVLTLSGATVSLVRNAIPEEVRLPTFVILIASFVTAVDLLMNAYFHDLHKVLGLFVPLIVTNCTLLGRAEAFASKNPVPLATWDGFMMGMGFTGVLLVLGMIRELLGNGTLFSGAGNMFGPAWAWMETTVIPDYGSFLLMILPPGAFLVLGFLLALKNIVNAKVEERREAQPTEAPAAPEIKPEAT
ncbi:electron transport complex subunit E [Thiohalorhabdus denitrificans]|uniref:Ion-translocating oxidoreductase complex subunit E n=1 Tax=Thiohalorhabdus denitrificans TaxID=381306 RepID=A0A1G5FU13_9GAMM|nr:electron transport complex subunit E [Thiohalorhabdus denitrificans]SCY42706.1 electron transport complex protein RnfE [Thiohalorhabdus denitrificans]